MALNSPKKPGKRALRAQVEAQRAQLENRLVDLLRALGLGAKSMPGLLARVTEGDEAGAVQLLGQFAGKIEGDQRRMAEALGVAKEIVGLPQV